MSKQLIKPGDGWAKFQLGKDRTLAVPMDMHKRSRAKLVEMFHREGISHGIILLEGGDQQYQYDTDTELVFRQDSWFQYLFGVKECGVFGSISLATGKSTLFIPRLPKEYLVWCGEIYPPSHFVTNYGADEAYYVDEMSIWLENMITSETAHAPKIHVMSGENSDSGLKAKPAQFQGDRTFWDRELMEVSYLYDALSKCRVLKNEEEIELMHYCAVIASNAHVEVMRSIKSCSFEFELEAKFLYEIYKQGGCRRSAYTSICACGPNSAVLHYGHAGAANNRELKDTDIALLDMGAEYHGYVSDITCSFPVSGKFTSDQRAIYEAVLSAQKAVLTNMLPGKQWTECHLLAEREILKALHDLGVLHNGTIDEYAENHLGYVFFPHGLGHLIGCDTHDAGGYIAGTPVRSDRPGLNKLRTARILEAGMVLTNEPGCYFVNYLLDLALVNPNQAKFINSTVLDRFRGFGGVRIEDVVLVTVNGPVTLSTCPRTVNELENVLHGGVWPPEADEAPELKRKWAKVGRNGSAMEEIGLAAK